MVLKEIKLTHYPDKPDLVEPIPQELFEKAMEIVSDQSVFRLVNNEARIGIEDYSKHVSDTFKIINYLGVRVVDSNEKYIIYMAGPIKDLSLTQTTIDFLNSISDGKWKVDGEEFIPAKDIEYILEQFGEHL